MEINLALSELSHDKARSITDYRKFSEETSSNELPLSVLIGGGVSDLTAAREADVLFARRGFRLESYCMEHNPTYRFRHLRRHAQKT